MWLPVQQSYSKDSKKNQGSSAKTEELTELKFWNFTNLLHKDRLFPTVILYTKKIE